MLNAAITPNEIKQMVAAIWRCLASVYILRWTRILASKSMNLSQVPGFANKRHMRSNSLHRSDIF